MGIPVGTQTSASAVRRVDFECRRCGLRARAQVTGIGEGVQTFLNAPGTAEKRARRDAEKDIERTVDRARCPRCKQRNPGAVLRFAMPWLLMTGGMLLLGVLIGYLPTWFEFMKEEDRPTGRWLIPLLFAISLALVVPFMVLIRWSSTDSRVKWLNEPSESG